MAMWNTGKLRLITIIDVAVLSVKRRGRNISDLALKPGAMLRERRQMAEEEIEFGVGVEAAAPHRIVIRYKERDTTSLFFLSPQTAQQLGASIFRAVKSSLELHDEIVQNAGDLDEELKGL